MDEEQYDIESSMVDLADVPMTQVMALKRTNVRLAEQIQRIVDNAGRELRATVAPFQSSLTTDL